VLHALAKLRGIMKRGLVVDNKSPWNGTRQVAVLIANIAKVCPRCCSAHALPRSHHGGQLAESGVKEGEGRQAMSSTLQHAPADFWDKLDSTRVTDLRPRPVEVTEEPPPPPRRSLGRRALRRFLRVTITLGVGIVGTLVWQAYGDDARQTMAMGYPDQLGWIAPQAAAGAPAAQSAPMTLASTGPAAPSLDQQQLNSLSLNLAAIRQSVEQIATQVASSQQQMSGDIARLQASEQDILNKIATPPPRPAPVAARKPPPPASAAPPAAAAQTAPPAAPAR
jgi:hypothetical protein